MEFLWVMGYEVLHFDIDITDKDTPRKAAYNE